MLTCHWTEIRVIDFTGVQAAGMHSDARLVRGRRPQVERTTGGDVTRHQLRDIPDVDACNSRC